MRLTGMVMVRLVRMNSSGLWRRQTYFEVEAEHCYFAIGSV